MHLLIGASDLWTQSYNSDRLGSQALGFGVTLLPFLIPRPLNLDQPVPQVTHSLLSVDDP